MPKKFDDVHIYTDGGARGNPGPGGVGVLILDPDGSELDAYGDCIGEATNNQAEYTALLTGLERAARYTKKSLTCHLDSELVVKQMLGEYRIRDEALKELYLRAKQLEKKFRAVRYVHHPRTHPEMKRADKLVNQALDGTLV